MLQQLAIGAAMILLAPVIALAQQSTGTPGSPSATTSLSGKQLPPPDPKFGGVIKDGVLQSKPWWAPRVVPPKGAPNVLLIMKRTLPMILQWDESFDIGSDTLTGVNDTDYKPPFALTAKLNKLTIKVDRPQLSPADIKKLQAAMLEKAKAD
ncbi:MAG TPA: hypothetical protein VFD87_01225 [Phototrophicaceae bacterium]|nr:hypothetical protein [Phototrophicaceae bacterium]